MLQIYHCVQLNALFCCLWRNVEASYHKHFFVSPAINTAAYYQQKCHNLRHGGPAASYRQQLASRSVNSTQLSRIQARNRDFCLFHLHSTLLWRHSIARQKPNQMRVFCRVIAVMLVISAAYAVKRSLSARPSVRLGVCLSLSCII